MGVYIYVTKPSHVATAVVQYRDGTQTTEQVALYRYAYKPSNNLFDGRAFNQRMRFKSGAAACAAAWDRAGKSVPVRGVFFDADEMTVCAAGRKDANGVFATGGSPEVYDDYVKTDGCRVVRWLQLPKGITEAPMPKPPLDKRLTLTTVLQFTPRALRECQGTLNYWVRLADTATGETQPEWTLVYSAEAMLEHAERYGVPLVKAPEGVR